MTRSPAPPVDETEGHPAVVAWGTLAVLLAGAGLSASRPVDAVLALAVAAAVGMLGPRLGERAGLVFFLVASLGAWLVFRPPDEPTGTDVPVLVLHRVAYFAFPALLAALVVSAPDRERLGIGPLHMAAPAAVMAIGSLVHLALRWGHVGAQAEIRRAAAFGALCYLVLLVAGVVLRAQRRAEVPPPPPPSSRAIDLEETGRFGVAAVMHERAGQLEEAARAAERAGDWTRAARLYDRLGKDFEAAEMFYRAQMWEQALAAYERARAFPEAASLCLQQGDVDRAVALYQRAGDPKAAVHTLEEAGRQPTAEQYRKAGLLDRAAEAYEAAGDWILAAEVHEHDRQDAAAAAALHHRHGSFLHAGRLLESIGRVREAAEAYAAAPGGALTAARLYQAEGDAAQARALLARLSPEELRNVDDEATVTVVARVLLESGKADDAARLLQGLKRRGETGGLLHLLLGRAFLVRGLHELAEEELRIAVTLPMEPADELQAAYMLGCALQSSGKREEAIEAFHRVLQRDLHYADAQVRYKRLKSAAAALPSPS